MVLIMLVDLLHLFFPAYCLSCRVVLSKSEQFLCTACFNSLPQTDYHRVIDNPMAQKFYGRVPIRYAMAFCKFSSGNPLQALVYQLKYGNQPKLGEFIGRYYGVMLAEMQWLHSFQLIIPVPLHKHKLSQRGYNQSDYFSKGLSAALDIPWQARCLQRIKHTTSQTKQTKLGRLQNVANAFYVADKQLIEGKHILLVDDIITTGATLEACSMALLEAGAQQVSIATIGIAE
jgi:ComF family protein